MNNNTTQTQVIGCRVSMEDWQQLEIKCMENRITISSVLKEAVLKYIQNN